MWTIETFTLFYERTWAQRFVLPFFGLIPLFISISRCDAVRPMRRHAASRDVTWLHST
jgi:hypothetical protein